MWKRELDPHVTVLPVDTTAFLPLKFAPPDHPVTFQFTVYLPTSSKFEEFVDCMAMIDQYVDSLPKEYPDDCFT